MQSQTRQDAYDGIRFFIEVNEAEENPETGEKGSVTMHVVHGTHYAVTNKRRLRKYLTEMGIPNKQHKRVLKSLGFWGEALGK